MLSPSQILMSATGAWNIRRKMSMETMQSLIPLISGGIPVAAVILYLRHFEKLIKTNVIHLKESSELAAKNLKESSALAVKDLKESSALAVKDLKDSSAKDVKDLKDSSGRT
jgi:hypothetical protein